MSLNGTQFSLDTSANVYGGTASLVSDHTALLGKQDKLTSANAGDNITIAEVGGVLKISSTGGGGTTYTSSDSIEFTGGTSPTANVRISGGTNSPLSIEGGTAQGLKLNVATGRGIDVSDGKLMLDETYFEINPSEEKLSLHNYEVLNEDFTLAGTSKIFFDGEVQERFGGGDIAHVLSDNSTSITSGTVSLAVYAWTRYTGTCDKLAITSVPSGNQESELIVTFAGTASAPDIGLPVGTQYAGTLPTYEAGKTYILNIRSGIVVAAEVKVEGGTAQ